MNLQKVLQLFQSDKEPVDEEGLIALVQNRVKNAETILQDYHRQWFVNIAMRRGMQYVQAQANSGILLSPPDDDDRVRMVINKMGGIHQTRVAKLVKDIPQLEAIPASTQEEDKDLARKGTKLLKWLWAQEKMVDKLISAVSWFVDCGDSFAYVYWDAEKGTDIPTFKKHEGPITGEEDYKIDEEGYVLDKNGERIQDDLKQGDVAVDILPSFDIINDGVCTNIQDSSFIIIQQGMNLKDIVLKWPENGPKVKPEKDTNNRAFYQRKLMTLVGNQDTYYAPEAKQTEKMATVKTMFERKSKKFPKGRMVVEANGVLLEAGSLPYDHELYPLVKFSDIDVSGSFWNLATMENLIPIQKGYNRTWSQILENGNNMGNIKVVVTKDHTMNREAYDDTGMEVLEVAPGTDIHQLQPANLPSHIVNQLQWYDRAFEDVSGSHEVSNAKIPSGVTSGRAILALQEQDDTRLAPTKIKFYRGIEEIGYMALMLYEQFQEEDRDYQIVGSSAYDIDEFKMTKADIKSLKKDVRMQTENIIAAHKRLQQDSVVDMYEKGLFGPQDNSDVRKKVLNLLEFGNVADLFDEVNLDSSQAKRENNQFINSENLEMVENPNYDPNVQDPRLMEPKEILSLPAYDFEDHETHLQTHNKLRKSPRYRQMVENLRKGLDLHCEIHIEKLNPSAPEASPPMPPPPLGPPPPPMGPPPGVPGVPPMGMEPAAPPPPVPPPPMAR